MFITLLSQRTKVVALSFVVGLEYLVNWQNVYQWKDNDDCLKHLGYPRLKIFDNPKYSNIFSKYVLI